MQRKSLLTLIGLLLLALVLAAAHRWLPEWRQLRHEMLPEPACSLHRSLCVVNVAGGPPLSFSITPRPIAPARPLAVEVRAGEGVTAVAVEFSGAQMDMGSNRVELQRVEGGRFRGETSLPVCTSGRMEWQAVFQIEQGGRVLAIPFRFFAPESP